MGFKIRKFLKLNPGRQNPESGSNTFKILLDKKAKFGIDFKITVA
jgi:hypothetical protein